MSEPTGDRLPVLDVLRHAYRVSRGILAGLPVTGRKWRRPPRECPPWCAGDHRCTAQHGYPSGEHRSPASTWTPGYGRIVAARTRHIDGTEQLELTTRVTLSGDSNTALAQGINLPLVVNEAIRVCLVEVAVMVGTRAQVARSATAALDGRRQLDRRAA